MLALRKTAPAFGLSLDDVPEPPAPARGEVLVEVAAVGICGSDVHAYEWTEGYAFMKPYLPVTMGHEFCGRIVAVGEGVSNVTTRDLVAVLPVISCMACAECVRGNPGLCLNRRALGLSVNGGYARYVSVPALNCIRLPPDMDPAIAALLEPLCIGDNAAIVGEVSFGDTVVVLGPGTIGQAVARNVRWRGASRVIVVGMNDAVRLETARAVGATHVVDLAQVGSLTKAVHDITGGEAADVVIEATGHPSSLSDGLKLLRKGGIFVSAGIHAMPATLDLTSLVRNRQQIRGAHSSRRESWEILARRIYEEPDSVRAMVSLQLPLKDALHGFERCRARDVSKVILHPAMAE
jgi:threonine dehydrogenase-like Zn-dependent dehydrogenase